MPAQMNITKPGFSLAGPIALPENEVQLWRVDLGTVGPEEHRWQQVLSEDERARAARFHFSRDRQGYVSSRALLRIILAAYLGAEPKELSFRYSEKDKPALSGAHAAQKIEFNISHSGMAALLAFTRGREVGVDVELIRHDFDVEGIAHRFFSEHERQELMAFATSKPIRRFHGSREHQCPDCHPARRNGSGTLVYEGGAGRRWLCGGSLCSRPRLAVAGLV
jgi:hypothetical protein